MNPYSSVDDELEARVRLARARMDQIALETATTRMPLRRRILMFLRDATTVLGQCARLVVDEVVAQVRARLA